MRDVLEYLRSVKGDMIELLKEMVELESPSTDKRLVDRFARFAAGRFEAAGCRTEILGQPEFGDFVRARWGGGGDGGGDGGILVLCHMDTVWPAGEIRRRPFRIEGDLARGPGVYDMKGGIVQAVYAVRALEKLGKRPRLGVTVLLTSEEEIGSPASRPVIEEEARKSRFVLVMEPGVPPRGALKTFRKGCGVFRLEVGGKAAHAGADYFSGVSAVLELARQIVKLHGMTDEEKGTTVNVGVIEGGSRSNVVAASANAEIDVRVTSVEEGQRIAGRMLGLRPETEGASLKVTGGINRPPLVRSPRVVALYERARGIASEIGYELGEAGSGGASDGNFTAALGIPTLDGLGPAGDGAHAEDEHVALELLPVRAAVVAGLLALLD